MDDPVLKHFRNPKNAGELPGAHGSGQAGNPGCGAVIRIFIRFDGETIGQVRFLASGSSAAIAAGSVLAGLITGKNWRAAAAVSPEAIEAELGLPGGSREAGSRRRAAISASAAFAVEALHGALEEAIRRGVFPRPKTVHGETVLVAMSGGVDSSVACLIEKQSGNEVVGVTMRLWSDPACQEAEGPGCCSPQALRDARRVCHSLGLPHLTVDLSEEFERVVVDQFVTEYMAGRTPNPCTRCNGFFRFPALIELAGALGASRVATGHYARVVNANGRLVIKRGVDTVKDQSYMIWALEPGLLGRLEFPLGGLVKEETRWLARGASLPTHASPESQEVCFIPDNDYRRFLRTRVSILPESGDIIDREGNRLGAHSGYIDYTIGQRRGLGVAAPEPLFVLETRPKKNQVVAGMRDQLAVNRLELGAVNVFVPGAIDNRPGLQVQVRYNSNPVPARVARSDKDRWLIELHEPVYGVAAGQSAVLYDGDSLVAGGVIMSSKNS